jgi:hypothetical protein
VVDSASDDGSKRPRIRKGPRFFCGRMGLQGLDGKEVGGEEGEMDSVCLRRGFVRFLAGALGFGPFVRGVARMVNPEWAGTLTPLKVRTEYPVPTCDLHYDFGWNNVVRAGTAVIRVRRARDYWNASASAKSTGLAGVLWPYECTMRSLIRRDTLRPRFLWHEEADRREKCHYRVEFRQESVVTETRVKPVKGGEVTRVHACGFEPIEDVLSAFLGVRGQTLADGDAMTRVVQPWDTPYLATFTVVGREVREVLGVKRGCIKLSAKIRKVNRETLALSAYRKMKTAHLWVTDDAERLPVEFRAEAFVGFISCRLTRVVSLRGKDGEGEVPQEGEMRVHMPR